MRRGSVLGDGVGRVYSGYSVEIGIELVAAEWAYIGYVAAFVE